MKKLLLGALGLGLSLQLWSAEVWCVYDPAGQQGDITRRMRDIALHSQRQQVPVQLKVFRSEAQTLAAFDKQQCSGAVMTNFSSRPYNRFMASSSGIGLMPNNRVARNILQLMNHPYVSKRLTQGDYQVLGFIPLGTAYMVIHKTPVHGLADLKAKRIGVLLNEPAQVALARSIGAIPTLMDIANPVAHLMRNELDMLPMPIYSLLPYNLKAELGDGVRVINFPLAYATVTLIVRSKDYPKTYAQPMRDWFVQNANSLTMQVTRWENSLPAYYWEDVSSGEQRSYATALTKVQKQYVQNNYYDPYFVSLSRRLMCLDNRQNSAANNVQNNVQQQDCPR